MALCFYWLSGYGYPFFKVSVFVVLLRYLAPFPSLFFRWWYQPSPGDNIRFMAGVFSKSTPSSQKWAKCSLLRLLSKFRSINKFPPAMCFVFCVLLVTKGFSFSIKLNGQLAPSPFALLINLSRFAPSPSRRLLSPGCIVS